MLLNKTLSPVFVFVFIYCVNAYEKESDTESDEDDKLRQALVLVDILKKGMQLCNVIPKLRDNCVKKQYGLVHAEYLKLLQSQYVVQQQQQQQPQQTQQQAHVESATTTEVLSTVNTTTHEATPEHNAASKETQLFLCVNLKTCSVVAIV